MTQTFLLILVIGIGLFYANKHGNKSKKDIAEYQQVGKKTEQNHYAEMRKMAFSVTAEQLGLNTIEKDKVYGIVSEMDMEGTTVTVVTFLTGDTSIYMSSGAIIIGAGQHESTKKVVTKFVENGQKYLDKATKTKKMDLPKSGMTNFNFLTENGSYIISQSLSGLESGKSEFSNLFAELNKVITEVRLKSEK
ncbi:hypothetical protein [Confluentibacter sediminis]|uniref:hypothetical protein n=1 Tax=Confluentibacter sediminis TaxID=2219045 RepID=UPI0013A702C0|nr:hypothetical protein [Confluentibacter sediminis]